MLNKLLLIYLTLFLVLHAFCRITVLKVFEIFLFRKMQNRRTCSVNSWAMRTWNENGKIETLKSNLCYTLSALMICFHHFWTYISKRFVIFLSLYDFEAEKQEYSAVIEVCLESCLPSISRLRSNNHCALDSFHWFARFEDSREGMYYALIIL